MLELLFGLIILGIVVFIAFRVIHSVAIGLALILLVFVASYLILGGFPDLGDTPLIGKYLSRIPRTSGDAIAVIKDTLYNIEILNVARDSDDNLLVTVANRGRMEARNFNFFVDNQTVSIINSPKSSLKSGEIAVMQLGWKKDFKTVSVQTDQASNTFTLL
jgi:hypothetical protein